MFNRKKKKTKIEEVWDVIDEMQENLAFLNDKVDRLLDRMGLKDA